MASINPTARDTAIDKPPDGLAAWPRARLYRSSSNLRRHILAYEAADKFSIKAAQDEIYKYFTNRGVSRLVLEDGLLHQLEILYNATMAGEDKLRLFVNHRCVTNFRSYILSRPDIVSAIMEHEPAIMFNMYIERIEVLERDNKRMTAELSESRGRLQRTNLNLRNEVASLTREICTLKMQINELSTEDSDEQWL